MHNKGNQSSQGQPGQQPEAGVYVIPNVPQAKTQASSGFSLSQTGLLLGHPFVCAKLIEI